MQVERKTLGQELRELSTEMKRGTVVMYAYDAIAVDPAILVLEQQEAEIRRLRAEATGEGKA